MLDRVDAVRGAKERSTVDRSLIALLAFSVAVVIVNLHTAQTIVGLIGPALSMPAPLMGFIATAPLAGYAIGLIFVVPLSDLVENRRLVLGMLVIAVLSAALASIAFTPTLFLAALLVLGVSCSCIQVLVPIAASMVPPEVRGRVVGEVMAGLMVGVLSARPLASVVADTLGWRFVYVFGALTMAAIIPVLALRLPPLHPQGRPATYVALIGSLWQLVRADRTLRRRALTASLVMAAFGMFWSTIALRLQSLPFAFSQTGIAVFALVGAGGILATPIAGRCGDRGLTRGGMILGHVMVLLSMVIAAWAGSTTVLPPATAVVLLGLSAVMLDVGLTTDHTLGRREINMVRPEARGRMNGLFVGLFFIGGACGATLSGITFALGGWWLTCMVAGAWGLVALLCDLFWKP